MTIDTYKYLQNPVQPFLRSSFKIIKVIPYWFFLRKVSKNLENMILLKFSKSTIFEIQSKWAHQIASTRRGEAFYDIKNQFFSNFKISLFSPKSNLFEKRCFSCFCNNHEAKRLFMFLFQCFSLLEFCDKFIAATRSARWFLL